MGAGARVCWDWDFYNPVICGCIMKNCIVYIIGRFQPYRLVEFVLLYFLMRCPGLIS